MIGQQLATNSIVWQFLRDKNFGAYVWSRLPLDMKFNHQINHVTWTSGNLLSLIDVVSKSQGIRIYHLFQCLSSSFAMFGKFAYLGHIVGRWSNFRWFEPPILKQKVFLQSFFVVEEKQVQIFNWNISQSFQSEAEVSQFLKRNKFPGFEVALQLRLVLQLITAICIKIIKT